MKIKLLLCLAVFIFAAQISVAQDKQLSAREQFEVWKQEKIVVAGKSGQPFFYFVATAQRTEPKVAIINLGIAGFKNKFEVTVIPLKMEQTVDGKWTRTKLSEAGRIQMSSGESVTTSTNFADPTMKIAVDAQANALQIEFKFDGESVIRFTTTKLSETPSTGRFIRLEEKSVL
jgi:hypothetical protein